MKNIIKTPSFIRLAVLSVLQALYSGFIFYVFIGILVIAGWAVSPFNSAMVFKAAEIVALVICLLIPPILGFFLVDRPKWWTKSLIVQLLLGIVAIYIGWNLFFYEPNPDPSLMFGSRSSRLLGLDSIGFAAILSMLFLLPQAVGVGIKSLWLKWRAGKREQR